MRILLFAGKGGVGKTSIAAATGIMAAGQGLKTIVMSLDPAHSLSDAFDLDISLMDKHKGQPQEVAKRLFIQELDIHEELASNWGEVHRYLSTLLNTAGIDDILAEELAVLPGMEEISALLHINRYVRKKTYDLIILDCAPTAESLRFVSLPTTLEWYMKKVFKLERRIMSYVRPVASRLVDVPLPKDEYFAAIARLFERLQGADRLLTDMETTSVRLVTNPEKMVLRETQRAFMFFRLHQLAIDAVIINRILPPEADLAYLQDWQESQKRYLEMAESFFAPVPILKAPLARGEVLGLEPLAELGRSIYEDRDPASVFYKRQPCQFLRENGHHKVKIHMPFVTNAELDLLKVGDELIIKAGNFKKSLILPRSFAPLEPIGAKLEGDSLIVDFGGGSCPRRRKPPLRRKAPASPARCAPCWRPVKRPWASMASFSSI